jgi:hypothetical protein
MDSGFLSLQLIQALLILLVLSPLHIRLSDEILLQRVQIACESDFEVKDESITFTKMKLKLRKLN